MTVSSVPLLPTFAALGVSTYLLQHSKPGRELFSLQDSKRAGTPTFELALEYALRDRGMLNIQEGREEGMELCVLLLICVIAQLNASAHSPIHILFVLVYLAAQRKDAEKRTEAHWKEVERKKEKLDDLRQQKDTADSELSELVSELSSAQSKLNNTSFRYQSSDYQRWRQRVSSLESSVSRACSRCNGLASDIETTGKAPAPVIQPLPSQKHLALVLIFYCHMPDFLRRLSRASFLAQQMLLPSNAHAQGMNLSTPAFPTDLCLHYNDYQQSVYLSDPQVSSGSSGHVQLRSCSKIPGKIGPGHIDDIKNR